MRVSVVPHRISLSRAWKIHDTECTSIDAQNAGQSIWRHATRVFHAPPGLPFRPGVHVTCRPIDDRYEIFLNDNRLEPVIINGSTTVDISALMLPNNRLVLRWMASPNTPLQLPSDFEAWLDIFDPNEVA